MPQLGKGRVGRQPSAGVAPHRFWKRGAADAEITDAGQTCDDVFEICLVICLVSWSDGRDQSEAWTGLDVFWPPEDMGREARAGRLIVNGPLAAVAEGLRLSLLVRP